MTPGTLSLRRDGSNARRNAGRWAASSQHLWWTMNSSTLAMRSK